MQTKKNLNIKYLVPTGAIFFVCFILFNTIGNAQSQPTPTPANFFLSLPIIHNANAPVSSATPSTTPTSEPFGTAIATETPSIETTETATSPPTATLLPITTNIRNYIFGHSLILHATNSDETTVPHWVHAFASEAGYSYTADGQYGFLPQHADLPPTAQWGFENVSGVWDSEGGVPFSEADFTTVLLTAANFVQYQAPTLPYEGDNPTNTSPVEATLDIIDWVTAQEPGIDIYIYENWPDMAGYLSNGFPPSAAEFEGYNEAVSGEFHAWWVDYYQALITARPDVNIQMIPVGPTIATLLAETALGQIPVTDLYEDDAPHGEPTIYFLAGMTTYMSMYGEQVPAGIDIPETVHPLVRSNFDTVNDLIWRELIDAGLVTEPVPPAATGTPTETATSSPTETATGTAAPMMTPTRGVTETPITPPSITPVATATETPVVAPSQTPVLPPTETSTPVPTGVATQNPTATPTATATQPPVVSGDYPPNIDYGAQGDFLAKRGTEFGRTADLTMIGPILINLPEGPGSTEDGIDAYRFETTAWDLSDLTNPRMIRSLTCPTCFSGQPVNAHGTVIRYYQGEAYLHTVDPEYVRYDPGGATLNDRVDAVDYLPINQTLGYSTMFSPWAARTYWDYGFDGSGLFWIRDPRRPLQPGDDEAFWLGEFVAEWDHLGNTGVTGFASFSGHLMIMASDQLSTGIAVYDASGLHNGEVPTLLSVYNPSLTEPDGSPIRIGGYWVEPYGANKMVWAARARDATPVRDYPAFYVVDFEDPTAPQLTCEIYFDQDKNDPADGDGDSDPMYVNFQDQYAFVDHFRVDIEACEAAYAADQTIDSTEMAQIVDRYADSDNGCDGSQYFRPLGQVGIFGGHDNFVTQAIIEYSGGSMTPWNWHINQNGVGFNPVRVVSPTSMVITTNNINVGDTVTNSLTGESYTITNITIDERINEQGMCFFVISDEPDNNPPFVSGHRPLANETGVPPETFIHLHIPETLRSESLINAVQVERIDQAGTAIEAVAFEQQFSHTGTLSLWPDDLLATSTSYRVTISGVQDFMGNTMLPFSFTFTTAAE